METIKDVIIPKAAVELFCRVFYGTTLCSLYLAKYVYLKTRVMLRKHRAEKERRLAILQRELKACEAALNSEEDGVVGP